LARNRPERGARPERLRLCQPVCHPEAMVAKEAGRLEQWIEIVARDADLDPKRLLRWVLAYAGLKSVLTMEREGGGQEARELTIAQMAAAAPGL
jgi:streptomycin 6-kinase